MNKKPVVESYTIKIVFINIYLVKVLLPDNTFRCRIFLYNFGQ